MVHNCIEWLNADSFPEGLNDSVLVLILKVDSLISLKDHRPIFMCNILYKIIAKALANRLKSVLLD